MLEAVEEDLEVPLVVGVPPVRDLEVDQYLGHVPDHRLGKLNFLDCFRYVIYVDSIHVHAVYTYTLTFTIFLL